MDDPLPTNQQSVARATGPSESTGALRYWAFISYSHHDRRVAHWLLTELQRIRVPARCRGKRRLAAKRLSDIFLDERSSRAWSNLSDELHQALRDSHALVVICSPLAAASDYVKQEIRYFQSLGPAQRIICVIASGVPNASDRGDERLECFPEPLRARQRADGTIESVPMAERPLAAALGEESPKERRQSALRVAAGILDVSVDELRKAQRRPRLIAAATLLALATAGAATWAALTAPIVTYARSVNTIDGIPYPLWPVSARVAAQLPETYKVERRGLFGKPTRISLVNGFGACTEKGMTDPLERTLDNECTVTRACSREFTYNSAGRLTEERYVSPFGQVLERLAYIEPTVGLFTEAGYGCSRSKSGIRYLTFERYPAGANAGMDRVIRYFGEDASGMRVPRSSDQGAFGKMYSYDRAGNVTDEWSLGPDGRPHAGYAGVRLTYAADGELRSDSALDATGQPTYTKSGTSGSLYERDDLGRTTQYMETDVSGAPILNSDGIAGWRNSYGIHGEVLRHETFDAVGRVDPGHSGVAAQVWSYDARGYWTSLTRLDARGLPFEGSRCAREIVTRGPHNETLQLRRLDPKEAPCAEEGVIELRSTFDDRGNEATTEFFDGRGTAAFSNGCHRKGYSHDLDGRVTAIRCYGTNGEAIPGEQGYSKSATATM